MKKLLRLFWEFFKISLFVVGGGYAIIVVADEVFGKNVCSLDDKPTNGEFIALVSDRLRIRESA